MRSVLLLFGLALVVLTGCGSDTRTPDASTTGYLHGTPVRDAVELPNVVLRDTSDQAYRLSATPSAPFVVLVFGYSHCGDRCSVAPAVLSDALAELSAAERSRVTAIFITVDPHRDDPEVLGDWLAQHTPSLVGLTGEPSSIERVAARVGVPISGRQHHQDGYAVGHGTQIIAFGPTRHAAVTWEQDITPDQLATDLRTLVAG